MSELGGRLEMLKQMRWREAHKATGGLNDASTDQLIRIQATITAIEAAAHDGPPPQVWDYDVDGWPLTDKGEREESDRRAKISADASEKIRSANLGKGVV